MRGLGAIVMGLLSLLTGCGSKEAYTQRGGTWYYRDRPMQLQPGERLTPLSGEFAKSQHHGYFRGSSIIGSDGDSFAVLSPHYAKDKGHAYFCFARRESEDYFTTQRRIVKVLEADPASFRHLSGLYAKDSTKVFYEGVPLAVKDAASFELLDYGFARDRQIGYYQDAMIAGSDGGSLKVLDAHYARDKAQVFYAFTDLGLSPPAVRSWQVEGALLDSFAALETGYAKDAKRGYFRGKPLPVADGATLEVISIGYAKTASKVFYEGQEVVGADASSFEMLESISETADSRDRGATYRAGRKVAGTP